MGVFNDGSVSAEVAAWFEAKGLTVCISDVDYSSEVRSSPWGRKRRRETITSGLICWHLTVG
jgi:hypothetical protein